MIHFICNKDTIHNGIQYREGQCWDGDLPAPQVGTDWAILQANDTEGPREGIAVSASRGSVGWKPQPSRPRAAPLSSREMAILKEKPYANLDEPAPAESSPPAAPQVNKKKQVPTMSSHLLMTEEERSDPYGKNKSGVQ